MADASCSGGTPFKRLVDQQGRDVSHQQDRLVGRPGAQGPSSFRSASQPTQGQNGFNQFMNGPATLPGIQSNHAAGRVAAHAAALGNPHAPGFVPQFQPVRGPRGPAPDSNWAAEFNRFARQATPNGVAQQAPISLGPQQAMPAQINRQMNQQVNHQMPMGPHVTQMSYQMEPGFGYQAHPTLPNGGFAPLYGPTNGGFMDPQAAFAQRGAAEADFVNHMDDWMAVNGPHAEAQIDAILERMAEELEANQAITSQEQPTATSVNVDTAVTGQESASVAAQETAVETPDIAALSLNAQETVVTEVGNQGDFTEANATDTVEKGKQKSEIAEAASDLLKSVQHEQGEKWKNSKFIELMTEFAEGRKDIVDNEIHEVDNTGESLSTKPVEGSLDSAN